MERIFAYVYLWAFGFCSRREYNMHLDDMFTQNVNDELLLELEECSGSYKESSLFAGLARAYDEESCNISEFGNRCYNLWNLLPGTITMQEPYFTLSYADDCLSYGDEKQTRKLYEKAFSFYNKE